MVMKKLSIVGASVFVNRMFEACGNYQWVREFLKNSLEANATKVEFGIEWQAVEKLGVYRRTVIDNGIGMNRDELLRFFPHSAKARNGSAASMTTSASVRRSLHCPGTPKGSSSSPTKMAKAP
jgi:Histidine kinase-, DNA gyrase B-, and HSP90-like ATPase